MSITNILTILAIFFGPIAAVQVQKYIERFKEKNDRKLSIFKTLMATRGMRLLFEHTRALNMIDIEFHGEREITDAWKIYLDCLGEKFEGDEEAKRWGDKKDDLFIDLLNKMATSLGYHFDKVHLKKGVYIPQAHSKEQEDQTFIRDCIKKIFSGHQAIPMQVVSFPVSPEALQKQEEVQMSIIDCLSGKRPVRVILEK